MIIPFARARTRLLSLIASLSPIEKILFYVFLIIGTVSVLLYAYVANSSLLVTIPRTGGSLSEGFVGSPRFVNPLIATTDTDKDISSLVYSGLMRSAAEGRLVPDLAASYTVSDDGLTYDFMLRPDATFQDGTAVTAADVVYTIHQVQNPEIKSPQRAKWEGVEVKAVSEREVTFTLKQPYAAFLVNATLGILPSHVWKDVSAEEFPFTNINLKPVGSGPYQLVSEQLSGSGLVEKITLKPFRHFTLGTPYISEILATFYPNQEERLKALEAGSIEAAAGLGRADAQTLTQKGIHLSTSALNRIFGVFFNQNQSPVLVHDELRRALAASVDKEKLVRDVLGGYGQVDDSPIPSFLSPTISSLSAASSSVASTLQGNDAILAMLAASGWKKDADGVLEKGGERFAFSIYTGDNPDLKGTAEELSQMWAAIGAKVDVKAYDSASLQASIIRPRKYDALLYGLTIGRDEDYFAFWHSSQRNDPGLNISLYTSPKADKLVSRVRTETDPAARAADKQAFALEIATDNPAVLLYSPSFIYALPARVQGIDAGSLRTPGDRFYDVYKWYLETDHVWSIFAR